MGSQYRLLAKLEGGELADLYRGQRDAQASVVVKLFHPATSDPVYAQQIAETQRKLAPVQHPGISHVIDLGMVGKRLAIVREDSGYCTLGQVLQRLNSKDVVVQSPMVLAFVVELLECVQQAHEAGVVHGALTPGNVLMTSAGRPAVCDFGALAALNASTGLKKHFMPRGRSSYRAPELSRADAATPVSDLYSLGAMTYELLTLREPAVEALTVRHEELPPPSRLDRRLSSRLDSVVMRALEQSPGRRFKAAGEMAAALRDFLTTNGGMPARQEFERFVEQLYPPGMPIDTAGPLPVLEPFGLDEVTGAGLDDADQRSLVVSDRRSFSLSVDSMAPTELHQVLAADLDPAPREPFSEAAGMTWDAPVSSAPVARRPDKQQGPDLSRRLRRIEDFAPSGHSPQPAGVPAATLEEWPKPAPVRPPPPATESFDTPPARIVLVNGRPLDTDEIQISDHGRLRKLLDEEKRIVRLFRRKRRWRLVVVGAAALAMLMFVLTLRKMDSGELLVATAPASRQRPMGEVRPPRLERKDVEPRPVLERPAARPPAPFDDCYLASSRYPSGVLSVVTARAVTVLVDGDRVCGTLARVTVTAGKRRVSVVDSRSQEHYDTTVQIEPGKTVKVTPAFTLR